MEAYQGVAITDGINRKNHMIPLTAIINSYRDSWNTVIPVNLGHDRTKPIGYTMLTGIYMEPGKAYLTNETAIMDTQEEHQQLHKMIKAFDYKIFCEDHKEDLDVLIKKLGNRLSGTFSVAPVGQAVAIKDKCVVEFIAKIVNGNVIYSNKFDKKTRVFPKARMTKRIVDITKFTGGMTKVDRHYPRVREDLERYLIQGLFDSDGCITWGRRKDKNRIWQKVSFTSQLKILEGVQQYLLKKLNISTIVRPKSNEKCYVLEFANCSDVIKFCEHIYPNEDFIILNRKYLKYKALRLELEENGEGAA